MVNGSHCWDHYPFCESATIPPSLLCCQLPENVFPEVRGLGVNAQSWRPLAPKGTIEALLDNVLDVGAVVLQHFMCYVNRPRRVACPAMEMS